MKSIFQSKTVWLNLLTLLVGVVTLAQGMSEFIAYAPYLVFANGVLNLILRIFFTSQSVTEIAARLDE